MQPGLVRLRFAAGSRFRRSAGRGKLRQMLHLLGQPRLERSQGRIVELDRKAAALLAVLALDGPTARSRLAGLLWPDAAEERARANLRQLLHRLRRQAGDDVVEAGETLRLHPALPTDLQLAHLLAGKHAGLEGGGRILGDLPFPDCPELSDWLDAASERLRRQLVQALEREADELEREGALQPALERAQRLVALEPFSERSHRRVIRLHYLRGDRSASLRAWEACARLLAAELGVEPEEETRALARLVQRSEARRPAGGPTIPPSVLRPPRLVGREQEWARMEAAWQAGRAIFLSGPPGIGKTRLALDFARPRGRVMVLDSRPGDATVPFASQARAVRQVLETWPDLDLPAWVRRELARMIPELGEEGGRPPPIDGEVERLRFFEAQVELLRRIGAGGLTVFVDNLQFCDPASGALGHYMFSNQPIGGRDAPIRPIFAFRTGALPEVVERSMEELIGAGLAERIELSPLAPDAVGALVRDLGIPSAAALDDAAARLAGGNPALLLELIKELVLAGGDGARALSAHSVEQFLRGRIRRLSPAAQQLASVAAVAGELFDVALAAAVLGVPALELAGPWRELEQAQILDGARFAHDLLQEAVLADLPAAIVTHLHRSIATWLEGRGDPTSIALHWQAAGDEERAARHLLLARS